MIDDEQPAIEVAAAATAPPAKSKWNRRAVTIGIILLLIGVAAIFWPIALLVRTVYAALGEPGATNQAGDMALVVLAIPSGSVIGIGCLFVGSTILVRARRIARSS
jgi:uncharacterized membrane protein HdeD (DUF308 family)